jgi:hypothetical protein
MNKKLIIHLESNIEEKNYQKPYSSFQFLKDWKEL